MVQGANGPRCNDGLKFVAAKSTQRSDARNSRLDDKPFDFGTPIDGDVLNLSNLSLGLAAPDVRTKSKLQTNKTVSEMVNNIVQQDPDGSKTITNSRLLEQLKCAPPEFARL
jgi:hypothetical protein